MVAVVTFPTILDSRLTAFAAAIKAKFDAVWLQFNALTPLSPSGADDYPVIASALASGKKLIELAPGTYSLSAGIVIPNGVTLFCDAGIFAGSSGSGISLGGAVLTFANSVPLCIDVGNVTNGGAAPRGITVTRTGTPPAGSIGVRVRAQQMVSLSGILSHNHAIPYYFQAVGAGGISLFLDEIHSAAATDAHWVIDGFPEVRAQHCRMGMNGVIDTSCNAYIRVQGGSAGSGSGPNTIILDNCHMNVSNGATANTLLDIKNILKTGGIVSTIKITDLYAEGFNVGIATDSSVQLLRRVSIRGSTFNATGGTGATNPVHLALNAATKIQDWEIDGNEYFGSDFTLNAAIDGLSMAGNSFSCAVSITAATGSTSSASLAGNLYTTSLSVAGSGWARLSVLDVPKNGATFTNTATPTPNVTVIIPGLSLNAWTPILEFGGATTGITYTTQSGAFAVAGNTVTCEFRIVLSSKGSATGLATVTLPVTIDGGSFQTGGGGLLIATNALSGITGPIIAQAAVSGPQMRFLQQGASATVGLSNTNFTDTSEIGGTLTYFL